MHRDFRSYSPPTASNVITLILSAEALFPVASTRGKKRTRVSICPRADPVFQL